MSTLVDIVPNISSDFSDTNEEPLDISVVIPCLNEERTIANCVEAALWGIQKAGLNGEVIVADNGSSDRSRERAVAAGARIVPVPRRGYGAALQEGFMAARGRLLVMGDADMSYDFREIPAFAAEQERTKADLVIGNRFAGGIQKGAMPWSHRLIGNPLISQTIRWIFRSPVRDCYCGLRMITRNAHRRLKMTATGMEYALEMIVQSSIAGMRFSQVPIKLHVDGRDHSPHLRTLRDGYRSFRFLFQHAPITLFLAPGVGLIIAGLITLGVLASDELRPGSTAVNWPIASVAAAGTVLGWLMIMLGVIARTFAAGFMGEHVDPPLRSLYHRFGLEHGVTLSVLGVALGIAFLALGPTSPSLFLLGLAAVIISIGTLFGSFVVSLMGRAVPDNRFYPTPAKPAAASKAEEILAPGDETTRQNEAHSLATQDAMSHAKNYNQWLFSTVEPAVRGARKILDVGCSIGNVTEVVARYAADNAKGGDPALVVGLEIIPAAAEEFRRRHADHPAMKVVLGDMLQPPPDLREPAPFDSAVSFNVLEHIEDDVEALRAIGALLKPGGRLGLLVPGGGDFLYGTLDSLDRHFRRYTPPKLRARLQLAGYDVISIRPVNFVGYFLWFIKGRIFRAKHFDVGEIERFDRMVPKLRKIDKWFGPPTGQSLAAVATWRGEQTTPPE